MITKEKISSFQLSTILIGFILGDAILLIPSKSVKQNAWLPILLASIGGIIIICMYVYISKLNPQMTLVDILCSSFGKFIGKIIAFFYLLYFLSLTAIILRTVGDYMVTVNYIQTPLFFILSIITIVMIYDSKSGIEVMGRLAEITIPIMLFLILLTIILIAPRFQFKNILPFIEDGFKPILKTSFTMFTFPFGEVVVFLMIFPYLNNTKKLLKISILSVSLAGLTLLLVTMQSILTLGSNILSRSLYPTHIVSSLVPGLIMEPLISINLLISSGAQMIILFFSCSLMVAQIFKLDDHKPFVLPIGLLLVPLSCWFYDSIAEMEYISVEVLPYYAIIFQLIIPFIILIISLIKLKLKKQRI